MRAARTVLILVLGSAAGYWLFADTVRYHYPQRFAEDAVRFAHWGDYQEYLMWKEIIGAFSAANPDVRIRHEYVVGFQRNYEAKIQQGLVAGDAPDVMMFQDEPLPIFADRGFADLTELIGTAGCPIDPNRDCHETAVRSFVLNGRLRGMPLFGGNILILWNKRCFERAERFHKRPVRRPWDEWTLTDFLDIARDLTFDEDGDGRIDQYGLLLPGWIYYLPILYGYGADVLDETRTEWRMTGPAAEEAFELFRKLRWEYRICPTSVEMSEMLTDTAFFTGRIAMCIQGPWLQPFLNATSLGPHDGRPPEYAVTHIPYGPTGQRFTRVTWDALCMSDRLTSQQKRRAWRFICFVCGQRGQEIVARYQRAIPALKASAETFRKYDTGSGAYRFIDALSYSRIQPITRHWFTMDRRIRDTLERLEDNEISGAEFVRQLAGDAELRKYFRMPPTGDSSPNDRGHK